MVQKPTERKTIRDYLLGQLTDSQRQDFEQRLVSDDSAFEELLVVEDELIDAYLKNELDAEQKVRFESIFLATSERQQKLRFGRALMNYVTSQTEGFIAPVKRATPPWWTHLFASRARIVVYALLIVGVAVVSWLAFSRQSDVDKGLIALNEAYRQQRPVEVRISQLDYAPFPVSRGVEAERVDSLARDRAERILLDAVHNNPGAQTRHALGKLYLAKKDFDRAITYFDEALKANPKNAQIYTDLGAAWLEKGKISLDKGRSNPTGSEYGKGMEELGRSLENLNKALELDNNLLEALFNRALSKQYLTLYAQAEEDWRKYLEQDSTSPWAEEARQKLEQLEERKKKTFGTKQQLINDFLRAYESRDDDVAWAALSLARSRTGNAIVEALLDELLGLAASGRQTEAKVKQQMLSYAGTVEAKKVNDRFTQDLARVYESATVGQYSTLLQARGLIKTATEVYNKAEYQQAIALFSKARELFAQTADECETLFAEAWVGYCYLRIPDPENGIRTFERLSKIFEARNYRSLFAQSLLATADALNGRSKFSHVLERAGEALVVSEQIRDLANAVRCLQAGTTIQLILGNYRESLGATFHALTLAQALPPDAKLSWPFYHEAALDFYFLGMPSSALAFENEALRVATHSGLSLHASRSYDRLALIFERLHNYGEAMKNSLQARSEGLKIADELPRTNILAQSAINFGRLYREMGDYHRAIEFYNEALKLYEKLNLDIYQYEARKGRLLALMALNNHAAAETELTNVLYWFEQNRETIVEESYRNKFFDTDQHTYDLAVDFQYSRKKDAAKAFNYAEAYRARSLLDLMSTGARISGNGSNPEIKLSSSVLPLTLSEIQQHLPEQTQLLEYAVLNDKILMLVVTKHNVRSAHVNISREALDGKIRSYLQALRRAGANNNDEVTRQAKELYASLIQPVLGYLNSSLLLCILPDDNLSFLPFAALVSPTSGRYLLEDYTLETAPSANIFVSSSLQATQRAGNKLERLLIVGNPYFDREQFVDLPDLPGAKREAEEIAHFYGATPLMGNDAVAGRVKKLLREAEVVHLATHAIPDERSPLLSKLLLSSDGTRDFETHHSSRGALQASEIYGMKFPRTHLVVLSACQTGIERAYRGEGAIGLARPFIAAGVPLVVASLWPVESEDTADLMISFHRHRKHDRVSTVEALRRAQLEILHNQQPNSIKNYGWAAFVAIGGYASF